MTLETTYRRKMVSSLTFATLRANSTDNNLILYFNSFGIIGPIMVHLKVEKLMYTLEGVSSVAKFITAHEESQ